VASKKIKAVKNYAFPIGYFQRIMDKTSKEKQNDKNYNKILIIIKMLYD
jgi:hypothetical protein